MWFFVALLVAGIAIALALRLRHANARLYRAEAKRRRLDEVTSGVPGVIVEFLVRFDGTTALQFASKGAEALSGLSVETVVADYANFEALMDPDDVLPVRMEVAKHAMAMTPVRVEYPIRHAKTGERRWITAFGVPTAVPEGVLFRGHCLDITAQHDTEVALARASPRTRRMRRRPSSPT
jgi:PAS domain-containing protein